MKVIVHKRTAPEVGLWASIIAIQDQPAVLSPDLILLTEGVCGLSGYRPRWIYLFRRTTQSAR